MINMLVKIRLDKSWANKQEKDCNKELIKHDAIYTINYNIMKDNIVLPKIKKTKQNDFVNKSQLLVLINKYI